MPRIPRFGRGEQDAPPEADAAHQETQPDRTQQMTSGDPLASPPPASATEPAAPAMREVTSGDPLAGATPAAPAPSEELLAAAPADAEPVQPEEVAPDAEAAAPSPEQPTVVTPPPPPAPFPPEGAGLAGIAAAGAVTAGAVSAGAEQPTTVAPAAPEAPPAEGEAAAADQAPADAQPSFRERTRLRRRMRELRRLREIAFRDLGGLTFDLHRFGRDRQDLVAEKLQSLGQIDAELRAIETALDARRPLVELREPGIAACPRCATLHGTDANFCPGCGTPLRGSVVSEAGPLRVTPVEQQGEQPAPPS